MGVIRAFLVCEGPCGYYGPSHLSVSRFKRRMCPALGHEAAMMMKIVILSSFLKKNVFGNKISEIAGTLKKITRALLQPIYRINVVSFEFL